MLVCLLQVSLAIASTFNLRVEVTPHGAGTLNISGGTYEEGSKVNLRTSGNTGYVFKGWYEGETLLSSSKKFDYTMPSEDVMVQARYEYDPTVPGNPAMPDTTTYYSFTAQISPIGAGSLNTTKGKYAAGTSINLKASSNTGYQFIGWQNEKEETLSTSTSFKYTMPNYDSQLTALYVFDPSVPANPDSMATLYTVTVACKPVGSGTFNTTSATVEEGGSIRLYAYTNTGYNFLRWENEAGETISTAQNFYYVIPHGNSKVYGIFEYDPAVPGNPVKNYWNKELGEVIVDDFTAGSLGSAVSAVIDGSNRNDVAMITVAGRMNDKDFGIANNYTNCTLLDLSRVSGITQVPSYAFDYTNLESVYLPATIEKIGYRAFYECKQLSSLTVYAMMPPSLENDVFTNVPDGLVVYVPASAITQYQDAAGWKDFTILPIQEDIRSLSVSLPEGTNASDYAQMWLELTNTKSGQRMHYIMTEREVYSFANIIRNTSWNVTLRNERGDVFGKIDNVEVKDEDVSVTFASLSKPQTVTLSVLAPDGQDVTGQTQVTWTDGSGNYLSQGASLAGLPIGYQASYSMVLSQDLALAYETPLLTDYVVTDGNNNVTCRLTAIPQVQISGKVKDVATGLPLSGATVSASQTFGGKYSKTVNAKTDGNGTFTLAVAKVPTSIAFAASDYISQTRDMLESELGEVNELEDVQLKSIAGATISVEFTYKTVEGETQNWYRDYQNVNYTLYNIKKQRAISQFNVQYPQIVLLEEVDDGDGLRLTVTSRTNAFKPVEAIATIADQKASVIFDIVELGKIQATFASTGNTSVVGSLYDAAGKLIKTYDYSEASLTISDLADGRYTLVSMGSSRLFNTIYDLLQLPQTGLAEGADYVQNVVEVKSGQVSAVSINEVPTLDESKLYYTGDNTSFTVNKPSIVAGNYLTLTGRIDFKQAYATSVSNVQMIIDLPESCEFVENSVIVGNQVGSYTLIDKRIIIPMNRFTDRVRFCVIPTLGGEYAPNAFAQFDLNGGTVMQPIGSAHYTAKDLSITVPSTVAKTTIAVSGTAIGTSIVDIYDNGVLIGQTSSLANGLWTATCELADAYNLSNHNINAQVTTKSGLVLKTETMSCVYDRNAIQVSTVTMINTAHTSANLDLHDYVTVFDFQNPPTSIPAYWYWPSYPDFTFIVDFTNNDSTIVNDVVLYVYCDNGNVVPLYPTYDAKQDKWVVKGKFDSFSLPTNVSVDFTCNTKTYLDAQKIAHAGDDFKEVSANYFEAMKKLRELLSSFSEMTEDDYQQLCEAMEIDYDSPGSLIDDDDVDFTGWTQEQIDAYLDKEAQEMRAELDGMMEQMALYDKWFEMPKQLEQVFGDGATYSIGDCSGLSPEQLVADGYVPIETTEGTFVYLLTSDEEVTLVVFEEDLRISVRMPQTAVARLRALTRAPIPDTFSEVYGWIAQARELVNTLYQDFLRRMMIPEQLLNDQITKLEKYIARCERYLAMCDYGSNRWKYWDQIIKDTKVTLATTRTVLRYARPLLRILTRCIPVADYLMTLNDCYATAEELLGIYASIPEPCPDDQSNANWCKAEDIGILLVVGGMALTDVVAEISGDIEIITGAASSVATGGASLAVTGWGLVKKIAAQVGKCCINLLAQKVGIKHLRNKVNKLKCKNPEPPKPPLPPCPNVPNVKDPSGYVYEGVSSNRIAGVTATAYYKETVEDMYGDLHENIVKWDASEYAQENPLFTDEYGMYAWDVPNGLWQVKFEKEGYETTYSEWLPVPPPQLDINIAMKQNVQPNVKLARAFEDAVEVEFDKYMMPELLTTDNIAVIQNGSPVEGTIELLNSEAATEGSEETFASKVRFNAAQPFTEQEITLTVNNRVKSYAGIRMQDSYQQSFTIEQEIRQIACESQMAVDYGKNARFTVSVLPASASRGKVLTVKTSSPMILGVETEQVVINNDGSAEIVVSGELPGTAALTFSVEGSDKTATTIANIEMSAGSVATPTADIASGTLLNVGSKIELSSETDGATIYYTTDGSCPCDEATRLEYSEPIVITRGVVIKAIAVKNGMDDSEVAEFTYGLIGDANGDGVVDVADVVAVVNKILNKASGNFNEAAANVNGDEGIDVADVVGIVNIILGKRTSARGEKTDVVMTDNDRVSLCNLEDGSLSLCLENEGSYVAAQFDIRLSDGQQLEGISLNNGRADGHCLTYSQVEPNLWRVLIYSMDGAALRGNDGELLNIRVIGSVSIGQIFFVMPDMGKRQFSPLDSQLTGIGSYGILQSPADVYSTDGRLVKKQATSLRGLPKGVYIIRGQKFVNW